MPKGMFQYGPRYLRTRVGREAGAEARGAARRRRRWCERHLARVAIGPGQAGQGRGRLTVARPDEGSMTWDAQAIRVEGPICGHLCRAARTVCGAGWSTDRTGTATCRWPWRRDEAQSSQRRRESEADDKERRCARGRRKT